MNTSIKAQKTKSTFKLEYRVSADIAASSQTIWNLLTNAANFPHWNSTVTSIKGNIALGEKIEVQVPISDRTFNLKVTEFAPPSKMVWSDGFFPMFQGVRTYQLVPQSDGITQFTMSEVFSGIMLPMIAGSLPDFAPSFEQYAADLKKAAEG